MWRIGLIAAAVVVAIDQLSKWWVVDVIMRPPRVIELTPFLNLVMGWNRGVSFGLFNTAAPWAPWVFSGLASAIVVFMWIWLMRTELKLVAAAIGLIIGGAVGNIIDRLRYGAVADFIDVHAAGYHWPAFNAADSAITVGAVLLVADSLLRPAEGRKNMDGQAN